METKSAFISIVGRPNVGKSSLLNRLVGQKIAIVSDKPQTTRNRITGVLTRGAVQFVFFDTPGLHRARTKLGEYMVRQVDQTVADVDAAVLVTECLGPVSQAEQTLLQNLQGQRIPTILVLNKSDLVEKKEEMLQKIAGLSGQFPFEAVVPMSARTGDGVDLLLGEMEKMAQPGPHFFADDTLTDQPERVLLAEIIREKVLHNMRDEIPHGVAVVIEQMQPRPDGGMVDVQAEIFCEKESHKGMLIGRQGRMLRLIATQARQEAEGLLGVRLNLQCWVKVKESWRNSDFLLRNFGYR